MSKLRELRNAARTKAEADGELEPEEVLTGAPVAYISRSVLRSLLAGKVTCAEVSPSPEPGDYALIAVAQHRVEGMRQREMLGELLTEGVIKVNTGFNTTA